MVCDVFKFPLLTQSVFYWFDQEKPTSGHRTAILSMLEKPTGVALSIFSVEKVSAWSLHALSRKNLNQTE